MKSPWFFDSDMAFVSSKTEGSDRFYLAVIEGLDRATAPDDSPAEVLIGVTEALCFLYLQFLDPRKAKSAEDDKALLLANVSESYDLVAKLIAKGEKIRKRRS